MFAETRSTSYCQLPIVRNVGLVNFARNLGSIGFVVQLMQIRKLPSEIISWDYILIYSREVHSHLITIMNIGHSAWESSVTQMLKNVSVVRQSSKLPIYFTWTFLFAFIQLPYVLVYVYICASLHIKCPGVLFCFDCLHGLLLFHLSFLEIGVLTKHSDCSIN